MGHGGAGDDAAAADYLFGLKPRGTKLGIDRMRLLAAKLGHPERAVPCVHVAGTNGKGSVSAMIEAVLRAAGWRVGLYTSPHLVHVGERVQVNRERLSDREVVEFVRELDPVADAIAAEAGADDRPSFFEFMTAMAFLQFARTRCGIAVVEVGLGGEFDATNVVAPEVSVITSIGLDHCEWLGRTIDDIARAKAGIIKPGRPVVMGRVPAEAERVIRGRAKELGAPLVSVREVFGEELAGYPPTRLGGDYQRWNAAAATLAVRALAPHWRVTAETIARGLKSVEWMGRWQRVRLDGRTVVLDASHNPEGAAVLDVNLAELAREFAGRIVVVVGVLGAERAGPLLAAVARHAREIHLVVPKQPRACGYGELESLVPADFRGRVVRAAVESVFPGGAQCMVGGAEDVVVITGSIYLLGEVLAQIGDPPQTSA